jgi:site-specific recombinase
MKSFDQLLSELAATPDCTDGRYLVELVAVLRPRRREAEVAWRERWRLLTALLQSRPLSAVALRRQLNAILTSRMHRFLYAETGILGNEGFFSALTRRALGKLLPPAPDPRFLKDFFAELFNQPGDHAWLSAIPAADWAAFMAALQPEAPELAPGLQRCRSELLEAIRMLSYRLAALGLEPEILRFFPELTEYASPFVVQSEEATLMTAAGEAALGNPDRAWPDCRHFDVLLEQCEEYVSRIRRRCREAGAGVQLTYLLTRIEQIIARLRMLVALSCAPPGAATQRAVLGFFLLLVLEENRKHSMRHLWRVNTDLLARRVTEHASKTGEHYVARTQGDYRRMFHAAAGAGFIIGFMALFKILLARLQLPPVWEAVAFSLNYGLGFVFIHLLRFTIATKQPAMTAATLAASLDGTRNREERLAALTELAVCVCRTQFVAILGNVLLGFGTALGIISLVLFGLDAHPIGAVKASALLHDLHPWKSMAVPHAAIAGVCLFLAGLISGYYDNKAIYNRIPQRLQQVPWLRRLLGAERLGRVTGYLEHNFGAIMGNFLFGCMLGSMGTLGFLLGLPLDIRHITFAAANLAYGWAELGFAAVPLPALLVSALGVALIGIANLGVSFALALNVAMRSRGLRFGERHVLLGRLLKRFVAQPGDFFWARREAPAETS